MCALFSHLNFKIFLSAWKPPFIVHCLKVTCICHALSGEKRVQFYSLRPWRLSKPQLFASWNTITHATKSSTRHSEGFSMEYKIHTKTGGLTDLMKNNKRNNMPNRDRYPNAKWLPSISPYIHLSPSPSPIKSRAQHRLFIDYRLSPSVILSSSRTQHGWLIRC